MKKLIIQIFTITTLIVVLNYIVITSEEIYRAISG